MRSFKKLLALLLALALGLCAPVLAEDVAAEPAESALEEYTAPLEEDDGGFVVPEDVPVEDDGDAIVLPEDALVEDALVEDADSGDLPPEEDLSPESLDDVEAVYVEDVPEEDFEAADDGEADQADPLAEAAKAEDEADPLAEAAEAEGEADDEIPEGEDVVPFELTMTTTADDGADPDALFSSYVDQQLMDSGISEKRHLGLDLTGVNLKLYGKLASLVKNVAAGKVASTSLALKPGAIGCAASFTKSRLGVSSFASASVSKLMSAMGLQPTKVFNLLLADYPYDFFWFDKARGMNISYSGYYDASKLTVTKLTVRFHVCSAYASGTYKVNASKLSRVQTAKNNARAIVTEYAYMSDYNKLRAYANRICSMTEYDHPAAEIQSTPYGDPWQLINVFDNDSGSKVVCEGYAKAFKYLCDLSTFQGNVYCYLASGNVKFYSGGGGAHMWNIVTMPDGRNYVVDVTHSDAGSGMSSGSNMFLRHAYRTISAGKTYEVLHSDNYPYNSSTYTYDSGSISALPASLRALSATAYSQYASGTLNVLSLSLTAPKKKLVVGDKITITPAYNPANADPIRLKWSTSNKKIAVVSSKGVVTAKAPGTVKIKVRTWNEKSAYITLTVKKAVKPTKVALNYSGTYRLSLQDNLKLKASFSPWNGRSKLTWTSSNKKVATVSKKGVVVPAREGNTVITVKTANGKTARLKVSVYDPTPPDYVNAYCNGGLLSNGGSYSVIAGCSPLQFSGTAYRYDGVTPTQRFAWKSSNPSVAAITSAGKITFKKYGTATITLTASGRVKTSFTITVKRNRVVFMKAAPTKADIKKVKTWDLKLKSVEVVNNNKVVATFYLINQLGRYSNYLQNLKTNLKIKSEDTEKAFLARTVKKLNVKCYKNSCKAFRVAYTGTQIKALYDLSGGASINWSFSGKMNYRVD